MKLSWDNITHNQYIEILEVKKEDIPIIEKIMYINELLGIRDYDDDYWDELDTDDFIDELEKISFIDTTPKADKPAKEYVMNSITFSTYITLYEAYVNNDTTSFIKVFSNDEDVPISRFLYYKELFQTYIQKLQDTYRIIYPKITDKEDGETKVLSIEELEKEINEEKNAEVRRSLKNDLQKEKNRQNYRWVSFIYELADGDITKYKEIMEASNILVHNWYAYHLMKIKGLI